MTWPIWPGMAATGTILLLPSPSGARAAVLVGDGRLAARAARSPSRRLRAGPRPAVPAGRLAALAWAALTAVVFVLSGPALALATAAPVGVAILLVRDLTASRRVAGLRRQLRSALAVLVAELEAGAQPAAALASAAAAGPAVGPVLRDAAAAVAQGGDAAGLLLSHEQPGVRLIGVAWQLGESTGAALAGVLARVAADLESAEDQRRAVSVTLAGPRSSAALLGGLPLLGIALGAAMGARPLPLLLGTPVGHVLACAGVALDAAGVLWIRSILRRAVTP